MDRESVERLRFDRRLLSRRGWVETGEYQTHVDALPDVSEKMTRVGDEEETGTSAAPLMESAPAPQTETQGFSVAGAFPPPGGDPTSS